MTPKSNKPKRTIVVEEDGRKMYQGEDRRYYNEEYKPKILGMSIETVIKIFFYVAGALIVLVKADQRLNNVESNQVKSGIILDRLVQWTENSDNWNSAQYGTTFKDGKPLNDRYGDWQRFHKEGK